MTDSFIQRIADGISDFITQEESPLIAAGNDIAGKPLPAPSEEPSGNITIGEDLVRFTLPSFKSIQTIGLGVGQVNGAGSSVLHFLPRTPAQGIVVNFPDGIYGIWIDPAFTTPGALIGVGNGGTRSTYRIIGRGEGLRFKNPVTKLTFYNADGLDSVYPETPNANLYPWGYLSFLIALNPTAAYDNKASLNGACNVSKQITGLPIIVDTAPTDGFGNFNGYLVSTLRLKEVGLNFTFVETTQFVTASNGASARVSVWFLTSLPQILTGGYRSVGDDTSFQSTFGCRWVRGIPITFCARSRGDAGNTQFGARRKIQIPNDALAMAFTLETLIPQQGLLTSNASYVFVEVYGYE